MASNSTVMGAVIAKDLFQQEQIAPLHNPSALQPVYIELETDDQDSSDADSSYCSKGLSSTTSLTPSVFDYTYANGRRYASDRYQKADYFLPNDDNEQARLDLYHHIFLLLAGGMLYMAELEKPQRVLDLGTGTGIWAIDFAADEEQAQVIGVDISPIQPQLVPQNCSFEVDDIEELWTWPRNHFDFIHMRSLSGCIRNWELLIKQCYDHLQPGGILEFQDYGCEGFFHTGQPISGSGTPLAEWSDLVTEAADKVGRPFQVARGMEKIMENAGFIDIHARTAIWPIGDWPKDKALKHVGRWSKQAAFESLEPFALRLLTKVHGWTLEEVKKSCERVKQDLSKGSSNKYYYEAWFIWGRKQYDGKAIQTTSK